MNIWKIASRWSDDGNANSSILEVFYANNTAFAGRGIELIAPQIKLGDLVALADGLKVVAIGRVSSEAKPITDFEINEEDKSKFDFENWVIGFKVENWIKLQEKDVFRYRQGIFHKVGFDISRKVTSLFEKYTSTISENEFAINAKTCTLLGNSKSEVSALFNDEIKYEIPIYQRPYSWKESQIEQFIAGIFASYWGYDKNKNPEAMFIGTMQLSALNVFQSQEIIDGQQRLTTLMILLKVLKLKFQQNETLKQLNLNCLTTRVSEPIQQDYWLSFVNATEIEAENSLNLYLTNAQLIRQELDEHINIHENEQKFNETNFINHLLTNVYFVVIETKAVLSKTLEIFNAINTTGLDLNAGDLFKIRLYEYLTEKQNKDKTVFNDINNLYNIIDENNKLAGKYVTDMQQVLRVYQYILIAKHKLNKELYSYGVNTFYEQLFDYLRDDTVLESFKNIKQLDNCIEDLERIISLRFEYEKNEYSTPEAACSVHFIAWSRYSRFAILTPIFLFRFANENNYWTMLEQFNTLLSKLYIVYSVRFDKSINEINNFSYGLIHTILEGTFEEIIGAIQNKIGTKESQNINYSLSENLTENAKRKNIICRLSAMLEEDYQTSDKEEVGNIKKCLFGSAIDIEHIQSYHDKNGEKREDIWSEWKENINSLGNLMVLEQNINRSISNNPFDVKKNLYAKSKFEIVKKQLEHTEWTLELCLNRKQSELDKLLKYLFNN